MIRFFLMIVVDIDCVPQKLIVRFLIIFWIICCLSKSFGDFFICIQMGQRFAIYQKRVVRFWRMRIEALGTQALSYIRLHSILLIHMKPIIIAFINLSFMIAQLRFAFSHGKKAWYESHRRDLYVKKAAKENYRSRAAYKLKQILDKYKIQANHILDLGCSPGSWTQMAKDHFPKANIIGIDLLQTRPIEGVEINKGDARSQIFHSSLRKKNIEFDLIMSDMAPNFTGNLGQTHEEMIELNLLCMGLAAELGAKGCNLVMKTVSGNMQKNLYSINKQLFTNLFRVKPDSSRSNSVQLFYVCQQMKPQYQRPGMLKLLQQIEMEKIKTKSDCRKLLI